MRSLAFLLTGCALAWSTATAATYTLQPGPEGKDTWVWDQAPVSHGNWGELRINRDDEIHQHILIEFDLGSLPAGLQVSSAAMGLYYYTGYDANELRLTAYRTMTPWLESVDWAGRPAYGQSLSTTAVYGLGWYQWDVTSAVSHWLDGTWANHGLYLIGQGSGYYRRMVSSDNAEATEPSYGLPPRDPRYRPFLRIEGDVVSQSIPEPATLAMLGLGCLAVARRRRR